MNRRGSDLERATGLVPLALTYVCGALLLSWVMIANGFPLLYTDSGTYLRIGTELHFPVERPITYGLFLLPFHLLFGGAGLWIAAFVQALGTVWLIGCTLRMVRGRIPLTQLLLSIAVLAALTSLPWFTGQLMPDLFTGLMALLICLIVFDRRLSRFESIVFPLLLAGFVALHLSHVGIALALVLVAVPILRILRQPMRGAWRAAAGTLGGLLILCSFNLVGAGSFRPSLESDSFLLARLLDADLAQPSLVRICRTEKLNLCAIVPLVTEPDQKLAGQAYLWSEKSPRSALERADVRHHKAEEARVIDQVIRDDPVAVTRLIFSSVTGQLVTARTGDGLFAHRINMQVGHQIKDHFPESLPQWKSSRQQTDRLGPLLVVPHDVIALVATLAIPLIYFLALRRNDKGLVVFTVMVAATLVANAAVCGILSGVFDRYQNRVVWLPVLLVLTAAWRYRDWRVRRTSSAL